MPLNLKTTTINRDASLQPQQIGPDDWNTLVAGVMAHDTAINANNGYISSLNQQVTNLNSIVSAQQTAIADLGDASVVVNGNYTIADGIDTVFVNTPAAGCTITMPPAVGNEHRLIDVKRLDTNSATLTLSLNGTTTTIAIGGTSGSYRSDGNVWQLISTYVPGTEYTLYDSISNPLKPGDTFSGATTEKFYASQWMSPVDYLTPGQVVSIKGQGTYNIAGTLMPTTVARIALGNTTLITSGSLGTLGLNGNTFGFWFQARIVVLTPALVRASGVMSFSANADGTTTAQKPIAATNVAISQSAAQPFRIGVTCSTANATFTLEDLSITTHKKATASN